MSQVATCLWFEHDGEDAARFYVSLLPGSTIDRVQPGTDGRTLLVGFTLGGHRMIALNAGVPEPRSNAASISIDCETQADVDRLWDALIADGGKPVMCGWLNDRWGVAWQIVPTAMMRLLADPDRGRAARAMTAMQGMVKLDIAALEAAADAA